MRRGNGHAAAAGDAPRRTKAHRRRVGDGGTLAWTLAPIATADFFATYFERQPLLVRRNRPHHFRDLLTLSDVDHAVAALHPNAGQIELVKADHETIGSAEYVAPNGFADPARVASLFAQGATVILPALNRRLPRLADFCAGLEADLTQPVQTNVYLTPPANQGFQIHYDSHDVFVFQAAGSKTWNFYRTPIELPLHTQSFVPGEYDPGPVVRSLELKAGDTLYIPRGLMHEARSTDETSLHITVGILSYTWTDLMVDAVTEVCLADPAFRRSLPPGFAREAFDRREARAYFGALLEKLRGSKLDALLDVFADHFVGMREVPLPGQLEAMDPAHKPTLGDVFAPRPHLVYRLARAGDGSKSVTLHAHGIAMTLPAIVEDAVRFALECPSYRAGDLPAALSPADKLTLVARLLREGLIERKRRSPSRSSSRHSSVASLRRTSGAARSRQA